MPCWGDMYGRTSLSSPTSSIVGDFVGNGRIVMEMLSPASFITPLTQDAEGIFRPPDMAQDTQDLGGHCHVKFGRLRRAGVLRIFRLGLNGEIASRKESNYFYIK